MTVALAQGSTKVELLEVVQDAEKRALALEIKKRKTKRRRRKEN